MVQVDLLEKFFLATLKDEIKAPIHKVFKNFREHKIPTYADGFNNVQFLIHDQCPMVSGAAISGFLLGIFAAALSEDKDASKVLFHDYLELKARQQGENVVDFMNARINKRS